jgi:hypothetical protein
LGVGGRDPAVAVMVAVVVAVAVELGGAAAGAVEEAPAVVWGVERQPMHAASESAKRGGRMTRIVPHLGLRVHCVIGSACRGAGSRAFRP